MKRTRGVVEMEGEFQGRRRNPGLSWSGLEQQQEGYGVWQQRRAFLDLKGKTASADFQPRPQRHLDTHLSTTSTWVCERLLEGGT